MVIEALLTATIVISLVTLSLVAASLFWRPSAHRELAASLASELKAAREEGTRAARELRQELIDSHAKAMESLLKTFEQLGKEQTGRLAEFSNQINSLTESSRAEALQLRKSMDTRLLEMQASNEKRLNDMREAERQHREEISRSIKELIESNRTGLEQIRHALDARLTTMQAGSEKKLEDMREAEKKHVDSVSQRLREFAESNEKRIGRMQDVVEKQLKSLQESNESKLEQMRLTVDEKLQGTLEKRLGESFKLVSERLEAVQQGLGEMRNLATGVGDLKKVLTNVKARGTWGEVQLGALLEQILAPDQFEKNVQTKDSSNEVVEFAIRLPGLEGADSAHVWLPIDAKFPQEDYLRLVEASESGDVAAVQRAEAALVRSITSSAKNISSKYLNPPKTTDFAILFLPTEGLYAEVLRTPGILERLQVDHRVVVAGPTTLSAILNSLRMGFRTLAIERRSSEVWKVLAGVKTEFGKFGDVLDRVKKQLDSARNTIDKTGVRSRAIERKLRAVEALPAREAEGLLALPSLEDVRS